MKKKLIFICSPFRAKTKEEKQNNLDIVKIACKVVADYNYIPIAPHLHFPQFLDDEIEKERELGIESGTILLNKCNMLLIVGNIISEGMSKEIEYAKKHHIKIKQISIHTLKQAFICSGALKLDIFE